MPDTSVIIPCYNGEQYLPGALETVLEQTRPVREVIIVDDGSRMPVRAPERWKGPPLRIVRTENRGLPAARNTGMSIATGCYVAFLDVDDLWTADKVEAQEDALAATPGASAAFTRIDRKPGWLPFRPQTYPDIDATDATFWTALWRQNFIAPSSVAARRDVALRLGGFNESLRYCEDWDFWFRLLGEGPLVQVPRPLCFYRVHPNQMSKRIYEMTTYRLRARRSIMRRHADRLAAAGIPVAEQRRQVHQEYRGAVLLAYFQRQFGPARKLLWRYLLEHPADLSVLRYALVALLPERLVSALRGRVPLAHEVPEPPASAT